jgi:hypothetical protein
MPAEVSAEVETPVAFVPQDLPAATIGVEIPSSILNDIESPSFLHHIDFSPETFVNVPASTVSSPSLSVSTISDLTPTELDEEINHSEEHTATRHDTFYFEDGNVEIVCGDTIFRVHSTVVSFSSPNSETSFLSRHSSTLQLQKDALGSPFQTALKILRSY